MATLLFKKTTNQVGTSFSFLLNISLCIYTFFLVFLFLIFIYNIVVTPRLTTAFSFTVAHFFRKYVYIHKYIAYIWYVYVYMCICVCICMLRCVSFRFSINLMLDFIELSFQFVSTKFAATFQFKFKFNKQQLLHIVGLFIKRVLLLLFLSSPTSSYVGYIHIIM